MSPREFVLALMDRLLDRVQSTITHLRSRLAYRRINYRQTDLFDTAPPPKQSLARAHVIYVVRSTRSH
jgi:hypothetical protein